MGLFSRPKPAREPVRSIPRLLPFFYSEIVAGIESHGGSATIDETAAAVSRAILATGLNYFSRTGEAHRARTFESRFADRVETDATAADEMIDWLITTDPGTEQFLTTLLGRLKEVLSDPSRGVS